jgi:hypothetical protein
VPGIGAQLFELLTLAIPVAAITWTVTHEEIFRELRDGFKRKIDEARSLTARKFFYAFTCEFCFSFYVSIAAVALTHFTLLYPDWRGYFVSVFSIMWIANLYMSLYARLKLDIRRERVEIEGQEREHEFSEHGR